MNKLLEMAKEAGLELGLSYIEEEELTKFAELVSADAVPEEFLKIAIRMGIDAGMREARDECLGNSDIKRADVDAILADISTTHERG